MEHIFIDEWSRLLEILIITPLLYAVIILYIRIFGKRTTSQMNSFDWIVTVALGSLVATTVIDKKTSLLSGELAIFCLMFLQYLLTKTMLHSKTVKNVIRSSPRILVFEGKFLTDNMVTERIAEEEVYSAIREKGLSNRQEVYALVLESDGQFSVIKKSKFNDPFSLTGVQGLPAQLDKTLHPEKFL
ncbi:DUF421 domain-containing protein [Membranicola marinus]|uniref:DUF421 domain-containing protein n=1 Tax=Membranihabitans marinus TaxID=1227546 RepID=A0A953LC20_9BACT|nr:YetF domain-containing protein [Membranihabitans marinus]MBY5959081.1 DUF421 domain-containing protein [Membranihabitans marinus]